MPAYGVASVDMVPEYSLSSCALHLMLSPPLTAAHHDACGYPPCSDWQYETKKHPAAAAAARAYSFGDGDNGRCSSTDSGTAWADTVAGGLPLCRIDNKGNYEGVVWCGVKWTRLK
jgi:hypothetical protein